MNGLIELTETIRACSVLVVGDAMLDVYVRGISQRLCQEAPVPIVEVQERLTSPGGAANTALNVRSLGARSALLAVIGDDGEGNRLREDLARAGVETEPLIAAPPRQTITKQRIVGGSQLIARIDYGHSGPLSPGEQRRTVDRLCELWPKFDAIVISDYEYGTVGDELIRTIGRLQQRHPRILIGDAKNLRRFSGVRFTAVKPNYAQAIELLGERPQQGLSRIEHVLQLAPALHAAIDAQAIAVTLDREGAAVFERGAPCIRTFTRPNLQSRAAGAGDTYVAALALALAADAGMPAAAEIAAAAAAVVVDRDGTSTCSCEELIDQLLGRQAAHSTPTALAPRLENYRRRGQRIVLTSGCFDILHRGHITYLSQARALGDVLVVGLNSDESISRLKGPDRPVNSLADRVQVLAALSCVDHVVSFDEDTPHCLVRTVRPDVFVKGGDYTRDRLPEAELVERLGGRVEILPLVRDRSTSRLISRIRGADCAPQADSLGRTTFLLPATAPVPS